jgi:hypothetical protein
MKTVLIFISILFLTACSSTGIKKQPIRSAGFINETTIKSIIDSASLANPDADRILLEKGVKHAASLWRAEDGTAADFSVFVKENFISDKAKRKVIFNKISSYIESLYGNYNETTLALRKTLDESFGEIDEIDRMFGNYSPGSHLQNDFYSNKIAFNIALNFPDFTLAEKEKLGPEWIFLLQGFLLNWIRQ